MNKERIVTILIMIGPLGGLIRGPVASLADYHPPPQKRLWLFIVPEFVGFACIGLMVYHGKIKKKGIRQELKYYG
jgi:hypothetical protein